MDEAKKKTNCLRFEEKKSITGRVQLYTILNFAFSTFQEGWIWYNICLPRSLGIHQGWLALTFLVVMEELGGTTQTDHLDSRTSKTQVSGWPDRDREALLENDQRPWFKWSNSSKKWIHFWLRVRNETEPLIWHIIYNCMNENIT